MNTIDFSSLDDIVHNGIFAIPDYQRDFSWGKSEVTTLLEDIENLFHANGIEGTNEHFCGSIVSIAFDEEVSRNTRDILKSKKLKNYDKYNVIDGQQRLSTLSLLLIAIRSYARDHGLDTEEVDPLVDTGKKDDNNRSVPVLNFSNINTQECYRSLLYKDSAFSFDKRRPGAKSMLNAYKMCSDKVADICDQDGVSQETIDCLVEQVIYHLSFVGIFCKEEADAYQIFESLNATGLSLTPADQVKNVVLMKSQSRDQTLSQWEAITGLVGEDDFVDFLSHYLFFKKQSRVSGKDVYSEFKKRLTLEGVSALLAELKKCAERYKELKRPAANNPASDALLDLKDLGQKQAYAPLLAASVRFGASTKEFATIADSVLVFIVRHMVCGQSSNRLDKVFGDACATIVDESKNYTDVANYFKSDGVLLDDTSFEEFFKRLTFGYGARPQAVARTYLRRIEAREWGADKPLAIERESISAEHIIPKQPTKQDLRNWLGDAAVDAQGFELDDFTEQVIKSIGNLVLLYPPENSSAGNQGYGDKLKIYKTDLKDKSGHSRGVPVEVFKLVDELVKEYPDRFDEEAVNNRSASLAKKAVVAWS